MIIRLSRYILARLFFLVMGLPVGRYRREVQRLWGLNKASRSREVEQLLAHHRPVNSDGKPVAGLEALKASPSLSKKQLQSQFDKAQVKTAKSSFGRHTAGTTGEPTHVLLNRSELARMLAVRDYCFRRYGVKVGYREARLWGRPESGFKVVVKNFLMNRRVFHPVGSEAEFEVLELVKWRPDYLYGYSSLLLEAAKILDQMDLAFEPPKCVICTAESILPAQKSYISRVFNAPVAEEYGATEFDVIAFECRNGHRHLVNPWLLVEEGEENGLVSDVSRTTQNLIRYELGDSFTVRSSNCRNLGDVRYLETIHGRTIDIFFYINETRKVHIISISRILDRYFEKYNDIFSFQLVQHKFSEIEIIIDVFPLNGVSDLKDFLEFEIGKIAKDKISVWVKVDSNWDAGKKRNYFIQNMEVKK